MDTRWARVARGLAAALFSTFVAALSHSLAGGAAPSMFGVTASVLLATLICTIFTGRSMSLWRLAASVAASQVMFHALFANVGIASSVVHSHGGASTLLLGATAGAHSTMWFGHAVAGVVTIVALRYAERAFWGLAGTVRLYFARFRAIFVHTTASYPRSLFAASEPVITRLRDLLSPMRHRGPPEWVVG